MLDLPRDASRFLCASAFVAATLIAAVGHARVPVAPEARALQARLSRCWDQAEAEAPAVVRYGVVVEVRGARARSVTVEGPALGQLRPCLRAALRRHAWPDRAHRVAFPLVFTRRTNR